MPFGPTWADKFLGLSLLGSPVTAVATVYLALLNSVGSGGLSVSEVPSGTAYARQRIIFGTTSNRRSTNTNSFAFPAASTPWGDVPHIGVYDAASSGNLIAWGTLANTRTITTSAVAAVAVGSIALRMDY